MTTSVSASWPNIPTISLWMRSPFFEGAYARRILSDLPTLWEGLDCADARLLASLALIARSINSVSSLVLMNQR